MRRAVALAWSLVLALPGCGRTGVWGLLPEDEAGGEANGGRGGTSGRGGSAGKAGDAGCVLDSDCPAVELCTRAVCTRDGGRGSCGAERVTCDDGLPCTVDRCDPVSGACSNLAPSDADGDGFFGQAPSGAPASCGADDCDDADPNVHPGAQELCNSRDDDCDGSIDDAASLFVDRTLRRLTEDMDRSQHGGIAWNGDAYGLNYGYTSPNFHKQSFFGLYDATGSALGSRVAISEINADTFQGSVAWSGQSFLTAWSDARQSGNYEVYTTRFDTAARELSADQRLTEAPDFSVRPSVRFTGKEYVVLWDDHRFEDSGGSLAIYARRLSVGGTPLGNEVRLTPDGADAQYGAFAVGADQLGVAYVVRSESDFSRLMFVPLDANLQQIAAPIVLAEDAQEPSVTYSGGRFVVAWHTGSEARNWGSALYAALVEPSGGPVVTTRAVTSGDAHAKWRTLVPLGGRVVLIWSGEDDTGAYSLFYEQLSTLDLSLVSPRRLFARSESGGDLVDPLGALGPDGQIGVVFDENQSGIYRAYFQRFSCVDFAIR